jgi:hypothetical protein
MLVRAASVHISVTSALLAALSASCSDEAAPSGADAPELTTAFVLGTRVWDDTTTTSYFYVAPSLEEGTTVDASRALEVPGAAKLYAAYDGPSAH